MPRPDPSAASGGALASPRVRMTPEERRATTGLASIYGLRMLGMFIVLPVLALYAEKLPGGADHAMIGLALGAYGLTQAILQIPFGWASDRWGRKPVIVFGLVLFALGSFIAAWAPTIEWILVGRVIQGAGAISAAVIALTADLTRESVRTRAMAAIGMTIGATFGISLIAGPALTAIIGVPGVFVMTGLLALGAMVVLRVSVPRPVTHGLSVERGQWGRVLADPSLLRLNYGIFALHASLMALFVQVPFMLRDGGIPADRHWLVYLPVLLVSVALMMPAMMRADSPERAKSVFAGAVLVLLIGQCVLALPGASLAMIIGALVVFFTGFNLLEATLPSLVSKVAPASMKGTAVGVYSCVQFLGTFAGAAIGGWLSQRHGASSVFAFCIVLTALWLAVARTMATPPAVETVRP